MKAKRILALVLSLCMIASALGVGMPVFAAGSDDTAADTAAVLTQDEAAVDQPAEEALTEDEAAPEQAAADEALPDEAQSDEAQAEEAQPEDSEEEAAIPAIAQPDANRFVGLSGEEIIKVFNQTSAGRESLLAGMTDEEWATINATLTEDEKARLDSILAGGEDQPAAISNESGIELAAIDGALQLSNETKQYLAAHAGTYVTEKDYNDGTEKQYEDTEWSIVIAPDGNNVQLLHSGQDTDAKLTSVGTANPQTGMPQNLTFSKEGEWFTNNGSSNQSLVFSWNQYGYFTMPNVTVYDKEKNPTYYFSSAVHMYNQTKVKNYFLNYVDTYEINDGSNWKITVDEYGNLKMSDGVEEDNIFLDYVNFGNTAETYDNFVSFIFSSENWYNANGGTNKYHTLTVTWEEKVGVNADGNTNTSSRPEGFDRHAFKPNGTIYNTDKSILKVFVNGSTLFTPNKGDFSTNYFKDYAGTYSISGAADLAAHYDPIFANMKLKVEDSKVQVTYDGTTWYTASFSTGRTEQSKNNEGKGGEEEWIPSVANMLVYMPGYYTNKECTTPAYLTITWQINTSDKNESEGKGAWRFAVAAANLYKPAGDGVSSFLRMPPIYFDSDEHYIQKAKDFLKNYAGTYHYNYDNAPGEYMQITDQGEVVWYYYNGTELEKRDPAYYTFGSDNINAESLNNNSLFNYINGDSSFENPWKVASVTFTDNSWFDNATTKSDATVNRSLVTIGFDYTHDRFTLPGNKPIYTAMNGEAEGTLIRKFNAPGVGGNGSNIGTDREKYIRYDKVNEYLGNAPREYTLNDNSGWKITIDPTTGQPTLTNSDIATASNIKVTDVTYVNTTNADKIYPYEKKGLSSFSFRSPDWYDLAGTSNYQTFIPAWSHYVSVDAKQTDRPEGFERYAFSGNMTLYDNTEPGHILKKTQGAAFFTADGGFANEYFRNYTGEYTLAPGFGANYNEMYKNWKINIDDYGTVKLTTDQGEFKPVLNAVNRFTRADAEGNNQPENFVYSVGTMYAYLPGYYTDTACTTPAYLTLRWTVNNDNRAHENKGDPYKYFTIDAGYFYQPDANGDGEPEKFKAPTLYFMHTDYMNWYKNYYKDYAGKYYINRPGTTENLNDEYIEIKDDGTPVYHAFDGVDHELAFVNMSDAQKYVMKDPTVYPSSIVFTDYDWYSRNDNESTANIYPATYAFTWANDMTAPFQQPRRFTAPNAAVYAVQQKGEDGNWNDPSETELLHYFSGNMNYTYPGSAEFDPNSEENPANDKDKASIAEMKQYLKQFAYLPGGESEEYTEYSFNDPNIDWGIRITKDGDVLVDFDDNSNEFVKVNPKPVFAYNATNPAVGINGRYLYQLFIEVPDHYNDAAATTPAYITLTWPGNYTRETLLSHYFTAGGTMYHKPGETAHDKVILSSAERFVCDSELDEDRHYIAEFAGEYYANDGSEWRMKIDDQGNISLKFDESENKEENYKDVVGAPSFATSTVYDKYVSSIVVPLEGWYDNLECTQNASLTLTPYLRNSGNAEDQQYLNNYFTITAKTVYKPDEDGDDVPEHMTVSAIDLCAEHDYLNAQQWLSQNKYKGTYRPQMTDKWYAEINEYGEVYFYVDNGKDAEGNIQYKKIKPRVTLKSEISDATHVASGVSGFVVMFPNARVTMANNSIQAIEQMQKVSFGAATINGQAPVLGDETAYIYAGNTTLFDPKKADGTDWTVVPNSDPGYNKTFTKLYANDRAYSEENKTKAHEYFKQFKGTYYLDDPSVHHYINIDDTGDITWVPEDSESLRDKSIYSADVAFNSDNATLDENGMHLPKTISVLYNGFRTEADDKDDLYNGFTQFARGDITWNQYGRNANEMLTYHTFTAGLGNVYPDNKGTKGEQPFSINGNYRYYKTDQSNYASVIKDGTYETGDGQYKIEVKTTDANTTYTLTTPDGETYPLSPLGTEEGGYYLRGKIGTTWVFGMFGIYGEAIVSNPTAQISYRDKDNNNIVLPANTTFTDFGPSEEGSIVVANPGQTVDTGTKYARFYKAMHDVQDGGTIYLTDDFEMGYMAELGKSADGEVKKVTIDGQGHTITRATIGGVTYTGSLFKVDKGDELTIKNVKIDAGGYWYWNNDKLNRLIQISVYGTRVSERGVSWYSDVYAHGGEKPVEYGKRDPNSTMLDPTKDLSEQDFPRTPYDPNGYASGAALSSDIGADAAEGKNITTTGNLIQVGGTVNLENTEVGYMSTYNEETDTYGYYAVFGVTDAGATINMNEGTDIHNLDANCGQLVRELKDNTHINMTGAKVHECHSAWQNGGLMSIESNHYLTINEGTDIYDMYSYNSNGSAIMVHGGGTFTMNGGKIHHIFGPAGPHNGHGVAVYLHNNSTFIMTGGEIAHNIAHSTSTIYQWSNNTKMELDGGRLYDNLNYSYGGNEMDGVNYDYYLNGQNVFGPNMTVDGDVVLDSKTLTNHGTMTGSLAVFSYTDGENTTTFSNYGSVEGDVYLENGANVTNEATGTMKGNVTIENSEEYDTPGTEYFVNKGEIVGDLTVSNDAKVFNSGHIDANVTVKNGGEIVLDGGGYIEGDVTLYPGSELRTNDNSQQGKVVGKLTIEYKDEEDRQRFEDILRDSNIDASGGVEYKLHEHSGREVHRDATCYREGYTYLDCPCGEQGNYTTIPMTPHNLQRNTALEHTATCTEPATVVFACVNEGCTYSETTTTGVALGHDPVLDDENSVAPTTVSEGIVAMKCSRDCGWTETASIPTLSIGSEGHNMQYDDQLSYSAGCDHTGLYVLKCTDCGQTVEVSIPATPHNFNSNAVEIPGSRIEPADCVTDGEYQTHRVCQVCGAEEEGSVETVAIPAQGHQWSEWDIDEESRRFCTDETTQTRTCSACGETETEVARAKAHDWQSFGDGSMEKCSVCGMVQGGLNIEYNVNGGTAPQTLLSHIKMTYAPGDADSIGIKLWQPTDETDPDSAASAGIVNGSWTKYTAFGNAVFVGWSDVDCGAEPFYNEAPTNAHFITTVDITETVVNDPQVYAVWALDRNNNQIADYTENKVSLAYQALGGEGTVPEPLTDLLVGASYPLTTETNLYKNEGKAIFAGWSVIPETVDIPAHGTTIDSSVIDAYGNPVSEVSWTDAEGHEQSVELVTSPYTIPQPTSGNYVNLYAVYAETDDQGNAGFDSNYYHVEYYAPGATGNRYSVDETTGWFYTCNDHHSPGESAALMSTQSASVMIYKPGAVLIGWTQNEEWNNPGHALIDNENDESTTLVTEVAIPDNENAKVYAVWAVDSNGNGIRDYGENRLAHAYNLNERFSNHASSGSDIPTLPYEDENGNPITEDTIRISEENRAKLPAIQYNVLPGDYVAFPGTNIDSPDENIKFEDSNVIKEADLYLADGETLYHHYAQIGWSGFSHGVSRSLTDENNWVIGKMLLPDTRNPNPDVAESDSNGYLDHDGYYHRAIVDTRFVNAYVVWAVDDNYNYIADYNETPYKVTFDGNGCDAASVIPDTIESILPNMKIDIDASKLSRDKAVLIGWSQTKLNGLVASDVGLPEDITEANEYRIPERAEDDERTEFTVYAVWAVDENGNGTPDYEESAPPVEPSNEPSAEPSSEPSSEPSAEPTMAPVEPTEQPSAEPSTAPVEPTEQPSAEPTEQPTAAPTEQPTTAPTEQPTTAPTEPTNAPTEQPTTVPTEPTNAPTEQPTTVPTEPTNAPTEQPTTAPIEPTNAPTDQPTTAPTEPTNAPTEQPTTAPTEPTNAPTEQPTIAPTEPTIAPTEQPTTEPTVEPSSEPTAEPTLEPSSEPTETPAPTPTRRPSYSGGGGGFGGGTFGTGATATPKPTATADPNATANPNATTVPGAPTAAPAAGDQVFEDVPADHWAYSYIMDLYNMGIINGETATLFVPDDNVTRAEFAKMAVLLFGLTAQSAESKFVDVTAGDWFAPYVIAATEAGIVLGTSETTYSPNDNITREQIAAIIGREMNWTSDNPLDYSDADTIEEYALPYVTGLTEQGILTGDNGMFRPKDNSTRAEAAAIIDRVKNH